MRRSEAVRAPEPTRMPLTCTHAPNQMVAELWRSGCAPSAVVSARLRSRHATGTAPKRHDCP